MLESDLEPVTQESLLSHDLLHFYDEVTEFNDHCAFLCDAFSCLVTEQDCIELSTANGLSRQAGSMKRRMEMFKLKLKCIHQKASALNKVSDR